MLIFNTPPLCIPMTTVTIIMYMKMPSLSPQAGNYFECYVKYCTNQVYQTREMQECL